MPLRRIWVVLDPTLRVLKVIPFVQDGGDAKELVSFLKSLPPPSRFAGFQVQAPILVLPNVFEPEFCEKLIALYEAHGGEESGFMRQVEDKTVLLHDHTHKRRRDHIIEDKDIIKEAQQRFRRSVVPELLKTYQYKATRMERYLVGCYRVEDAAHFVDGGEISFPEYGPKGFKPSPGTAVVLSCSLLHAVSEVTRGRRYAFLPFM